MLTYISEINIYLDSEYQYAIFSFKIKLNVVFNFIVRSSGITVEYNTNISPSRQKLFLGVHCRYKLLSA